EGHFDGPAAGIQTDDPVGLHRLIRAEKILVPMGAGQVMDIDPPQGHGPLAALIPPAGSGNVFDSPRAAAVPSDGGPRAGRPDHHLLRLGQRTADEPGPTVLPR